MLPTSKNQTSHTVKNAVKYHLRTIRLQV